MQGRRIRSEDLALIGGWLAAFPHWNRTRLSRELCLAWNWRNAAGRLKDMACRTLLLKLEARGQICLPSRRTASVNRLRNGRIAEIAHDESAIDSSLDRLQPVQLEALAEGTATNALFNFLLQRYHYLGHRHGVGEKLKYLARDRSGRPLACVLFGSAAWQAGPRDAWIGWDAAQRQRSLCLLTNNTRFLILPWVRVPHLASHLLGLVTARLSADWQNKYSHPIYLLETFVERERFRAVCYRATGWLPVGTTTGRGRNDDRSRPQAPCKEIYLKPLLPDWRRRLGL